jgi:hypothetical protein
VGNFWHPPTRSSTVFAAGFLLFLTVPSAFPLHAAEKPGSQARPMAVLIEEDPWLEVIGADMPRIAVYDDGTIICLVKPKDSQPYYGRSVVSSQELKALVAQLGDPTAFQRMKRHYNIAPNVTDLPTVDLYLCVDGVETAISVYGLTAEDARLPARTVAPRETEADSLPSPFKTACATLVSFSPKTVDRWVPEELELMVWPFEHAKTSVPWPSDWPTLSSPKTVKRKNLYSLYMPGQKLEEVRAFLESRSGAVVLEEKKWSVALRYPFPGEDIWRKALDQ